MFICFKGFSKSASPKHGTTFFARTTEAYPLEVQLAQNKNIKRMVIDAPPSPPPPPFSLVIYIFSVWISLVENFSLAKVVFIRSKTGLLFSGNSFFQSDSPLRHAG